MNSSQIQCYLTFSGECREAMTFYQSCLGGTLSLQSIGDSPLASRMPAEMKDLILHAVLSWDDLVLLGSDMVPETGLIRGNSVSLLLHCRDEEELHNLYQKLSEGGTRDHPPENSFWGALFGDLTDRYGNHWLLNCERKV